METRQVRRALKRRANAERISKAKQVLRKNANRALLNRQMVREKSGYYDGRPPIAALLYRGEKPKGPVSKKRYGGRIIRAVIKAGPYGTPRERQLHATKGWREYRL